MSDILTSIPLTFAAGDTITWQQYCGNDYTYANGYTLNLVLINQYDKYTGSSVVDGSLGYTVTLPSTETTNYSAGEYQAVIYVSNGTDRYTVTSSWVTITPDLTVVNTYDSRSQAKVILDALNAAIEESATSNQLSMSVAGRSISRMSLSELIAAKQKYESIVASEKRAQDRVEGKNPKNRISVRWV